MHTSSAVSGKMSSEERFQSFSWLWTALLVVLCINSEASVADAVIIDQQTGGCGGSFTGTVGNFTSPGYPNNYAENLQCQYNITVDANSRIHIDFIYIEIEAGDGCLYDSLLFRDGLDPSSPVLAKICHPHPVTIKSSGSSVSVLFSSDSTIGFRGFHLTWRAVPKVPLLKPDGMSITSPWIGIATPQDLVQIDSGISEYLWAVDKGANVYVYGNGHWDLVSGRMSSVTSGESVLATSKDGAVWYRQGVSMGNPKGQSWQRASISTPMRKVESGRVGVVIAIDSKGTVYQLQFSSNGPTGVLHKLYDANPSDPFVDVSCGSYACWFVSKNGALFVAESIQSYFAEDVNPERVAFRQVSTPAKIKQVAAGFDGSVWAITMAGNVYKRKGVSMLLPDGVSWTKTANVNFQMITSGFLGVYGVTKSNIIITMDDMKCGGIITAKKGMFTSPNYPRIYPADLKCLWILRIPGATSISVRFIKPTGLGKSSVCGKDFLVTYQDGKYPSSTEPVIECGTKIADKMFVGNEAWFEFDSGDDTVRNLGFRAVFDASFVVKTTSKPTTGTKMTTTQATTILTTKTTTTCYTSSKVTTSSYSGSNVNASKDTLSRTTQTVKASGIKDKQALNKTTMKPNITSTSIGQRRINVTEKTISDTKTDAKNMTQDSDEDLKSTVPFSKGMRAMTSTRSPPSRTLGSNTEHVASTAAPMTTVNLSASKGTLSSTTQTVKTSGVKDKQSLNKTTIKPDMISTSMDKTQFNVKEKTISDTKTDNNNNNMTQGSHENLKKTLPFSKGTDRPAMTSAQSPPARTMASSTEHIASTAPAMTTVITSAINTEQSTTGSTMEQTHSPPLRTMDSSTTHIPSTAPKDMTTVRTSAPSTAQSTTRLAMTLITKRMVTDTDKDAGNDKSTKSDLLPPPIIITEINTAAPLSRSTQPNTEVIMPPKPAFTERTTPKQQGLTTDSGMPPSPTNVARTDRSTADPRMPPLPIGPHTDAVRPPVPTTTDTNPRPDMKTPSMGGAKIPAGWERVTPNVPLSQIVTGFSNRVWGLDNNGKPFVNINDAWRQVGDNKYRSLAVGEDSVWAAVKADGDVYYRQGITKGFPSGLSWVKIPSLGMKKVILGPRNEVFAVARDGVLYRRSGVTYKSPYGTNWIDTGKRVLDATVGSYGIFVIDLTGRLQFAEIKMDEYMKFSESDWRTADGPQLREINAGHSSSLWGIQANDGVVVERQGVEALYPLGKSWKLHEGKTSTVNPGMFDVYRTLSDGTILKRKGNKCGGIISSMQGNIKSPDYPSNYPANAYCLWLVKVPEAKMIEVRVEDFELEEDRYCRSDRMIIFDKMSKEPIYECGKMAQNKNFTGDNFMVEFQSDGFTQKRGFNLRYKSYFKKDLISASTQKPTTTMKKEDCNIVCSTDYNPICASDGKTYANECIMNAESCATNKNITMKSKGKCQDCPKACTTDYKPVCGSDDKTYANECVMKAESCFMNKNITLKSIGECKDCSMNCKREYDPVCGSDDQTYDNECIMQLQSCKMKKDIFVKSKGSCQVSVCSIKCPTDFSPVCGTNNKTYANECILKAESCLQRKVISVKSKGVCPESIPDDWKLVESPQKMSMVASGINDNLWALDTNGKPYLMLNNTWKLMDLDSYKSLEVDDFGVWGVRKDGTILYRKGVTEQNPQGESWVNVDGTNIMKVSADSMNNVLAVRNDGRLLARAGVSDKMPTGTSWVDLGEQMIDASISDYGVWVINKTGTLKFAKKNTNDDLSRTRLNFKPLGWTEKMKSITAGHGGSLWGIAQSGLAIWRTGISFQQPAGANWRMVDGGTSSVSPGLYMVYRSLADGRIVQKQENICGGVLSSAEGTIKTPNYPSPYPNNVNCLWKIKVPAAKTIDLMYKDFELESGCFNDRMTTVHQSFEKDIIECDTKVRDKKIPGDMVMIEFKSNGNVQKRGFHSVYKAVVMDAMKTTPKPEMKAPSGWEFVKPIMKMSMVASGVNDDLWALDSSGRPHVYVNMQWKRVQPGTYKSLAVDDRGVWGIRNDGMVTYRKGVTDKNPMGESWMAVDGRNIRKIITGSMNEVLAVREDAALVTRLGVSVGSPTGTSWALLGKTVKDASIGSYGMWVIDNSGKLQFARTLPDADLSRSFLRWRDVDGDLKAISAGFGGSLWGILKNGTVVKRENVNSGRPTGNRWMAHDGMTSSVSPGVYEVYRTLSDGTVVKRTDNTCGGFMTSLSGTLQTPNFPSSYPRNSNCLWLIKVPKVDQIEVKYGNFELEEDRYCRTDRMVTMAPRIYRPPRECGTRVQDKRIASNIMMIEFISNDRVEKRGFKASYMASVILETTTKATTTTMKPTTTTMPNRKCGGLLVESSGIFSTPNYPNLYPNDVVCLWVIKVPEATQITVTFQDFDIGNSDGDFVAYSPDGIYPSNKAPSVIKNPGKKQFTFAGNTAFFEFVSDSKAAAKGFFASYKSDSSQATTQRPTTKPTTPFSACGGLLYEESGSLTSQNYPQKYPSSSDCTWFITVAPSKKIKLSFIDVEIEGNAACSFDFVEFGDGARKGENSKKKLCENNKFEYTSSGNQIWIRFFSDSSVQQRGFKALWRSIMMTKPDLTTTKEMKTTMKPTTMSKTTKAPLPRGWQYASPINQRFMMVDTGMTDKIVALDKDFRPYIHMNNNWARLSDERYTDITTGDSGTWAIRPDFRAVFHSGDGSSLQSNRWTLVGNDEFKQIDSGPHNDVFAVRRDGIVAYRDGITKQTPFGTRWVNLGKKLKSISVGSYGIWGTDDFDTIHFAKRPSDISQNPISWRALPGLRLKTIEAGFGNEVWGVANDGRVYRRAGVSHDTPFGTNWNNEDLTLEDVSTGLKGVFGVDKDGRIITRTDLSQKCGGILTSQSGRIISPGYPLTTYPRNEHCLWVIRVPNAKRIRLNINFFDVYKTAFCVDDYMLLYKRGSYSPENGADKYCGREIDIPPSFVYNSNEVWIQFNSGPRPSSLAPRGFDIRYSSEEEMTTVKPTTMTVETTPSKAPSTTLTNPKIVSTASFSGCGGTFTENYGSISSPGFPRQYESNLRCLYNIMIDPRRELILKFDDFAIENDSQCRFDFLLIKTSENNGRELGKFCGPSTPPDIQVGQNKVMILFKSDGSVNDRGFRMVWSSQPKKGVIIPPTTKAAATTKRPMPRDRTTTEMKKIEPVTPPQIPSDWTQIRSDIKIAHIDDGINPNAWATDQQGNTYILEGKNWRLVGNYQMKYITSGGSGVWGIDRLGSTFYRRGVAPLAPKGAYWASVPGPKLEKIDSGPEGFVMALDENGNIHLREGITKDNPTGTGWRQVGSGYKHLSVGSYGYWVIDQSNQAYFAQATKIGPFSRGLRWTPIGRNFIQVKAGFGGSLWAVEPDGQLYERQGVTAITPTGISWKRIGNLKVNGVSTGMAGVFASVKGTNDIIVKPDRVCGDIFKRPKGNFSSPRHPFDYPSGAVCLWQIQVPGASKIIVQFDAFQLERPGGVGASYCNKDYLLYLRDGKFPSTFGVKKRCGRDGSPLIFEGDKAWIEFVSDDSNNFPGFNARYEAVLDPGQITDRPIVTQRPTVTKKVTTVPPDLFKACGGEIDAASVESGAFAHPGYPGDYERYRRCEYVIRTRPDSRIRLDFDRFDLEGASDCRYDSVEIRDGERGTNELIGKYCGKRNLTNIVSKSNVLYVKFVSDSTTQFKGFLARWRRVSPFATTKKPETTTKSGLEGPSAGQIVSRCGGTIDASKTNTGFFTHAGYPGQYQNSEDCTYIIKTIPGKRLKLSFDKFSLEAHEKCQFDYLEVRDGSTVQAPSLGRFCGSAKPRDVLSKGNSLLIKFVSDYASKGSGFLVKWNVELDNTLPTLKPNTKTAKKDAKIITTCGGILDGPSGLFATPNYPNDYGPSLDCEWTINAGNSKVIQLTFEYFDLEKSKSGCVSDYVQIFDGPTRLDRNLGKYCNKMPNELISSGSKMRVLFHSDEGSNYRGFVARWATQDAQIRTTPAMRTTKDPCFQRISGLAGEITKGGSSSFYEPNTDCVWIIAVQRESKIKMQFDFFDIESSPFCSRDFLKILDGPSDISRTLINECGRKNLPDVISSGNEVFVRFKTDARNNGRGFKMRWSVIGPGQATVKPTTAKAVNPSSSVPEQVNICDQTKKDLFGDSGTVVSPNYPRNFPSNQRCSMVIRTSRNKRIIVSFDDFSMEVSPECRSDALVIRDGSPFANVLSNACGSSLPSDVTSSSNALHLDFKSDDYFEQRGFRLRWTTIPFVAPPVIPTQGPVIPPVFPEAPQCGGRLYGSSGSLNNPTFNRRYPFAMTCTWILEVGPSSKIDLQLNFASFGREDCSNFLIIRDGMSADSRVLKKFCKNEAPYNLRSQGNMVYIEQHIKENEEPRFSLTWRERTERPYSAFTCGGTRTQSSGVISSPNYPSAYPNNAFCTWIIVAPKKHKISMDVTRFDFQDVAGCSKDYLSFRNGQTSESPLFGRYCGRNIPRRIESRSNKMWIQMKTDCEGIAGGFRMTYKFVKDGAAEVLPEVPTQTPSVTTRKIGQVVDNKMSSQPPIPPVQPTAGVTNVNAQGGLITGSGGILQSPNYPGKYPNNQEIIWVLKGSAAGRIAISFKAFNVEQDSACRYDYVELRDGQSGDSPAIGKFCGNHLPATYTSADNSLWVKFTSDASENRNGFQAEWRWLPAGNELPASRTERRQFKPACGGLFTGDKGEISTPNYPSKYPSNSDCIWVIRPRTFSPIELKFTGFSIEPESRCGYDYVEIRDGDSSRAPSLGRFCGSKIPDVLFSNGGAFWIKFKSDSSSNYRGFVASWKTVDGNRRRRSRRNTDNETKKSPGCSYSFKATNGTLSTDIKLNSHGKLTPSSCKWIIKSPNKGKISLHIKDLGFNKHHSCSQNYMDIYIHRKGDFELLTRLCPFNKLMWHNGLDIPTRSRQIAVKYIINKGSLSRPLQVTWTTSTPKEIYKL